VVVVVVAAAAAVVVDAVVAAAAVVVTGERAYAVKAKGRMNERKKAEEARSSRGWCCARRRGWRFVGWK